jgi:hypothetical protein
LALIGRETGADDLGQITQWTGAHDAGDAAPGNQSHEWRRFAGFDDQHRTGAAILERHASFADKQVLCRRKRPQAIDAPVRQATPGECRGDGG